jgi:hypothetical protein
MSAVQIGNALYLRITSHDYQYTGADHSGCAVGAVKVLRPFRQWDRQIESHSGHGIMRGISSQRASVASYS